MKRIIVPILTTVSIVAVFLWTLIFLYGKSQEKPIEYPTETAAKRDIVVKTVATGAIVPRQEIAIKPRISEVIGSLEVEPGDVVKKGDKIATIKVIPDMINLNTAEARVKQASVRKSGAKKELDRFQHLFDQKLVAEAELTRQRLDYDLAVQELNAAHSNLQLIREGASRGSGKVQNVVSSTIDGMVLDVPVEEGVSVIETNTFNEGTTIASVADMRDLIFKGNVDESEVGKISNDMPLRIRIGALGDKRFDGTLEYIAPKGAIVDGAIQFEIRAAISPRKDVFVRANYSATADIVLEQRKGVLAIREALLVFEDKQPFVEVETGPQQFAPRPVELGLSDGIYVEVLKGVSGSDRLKAPVSAGASKSEGKRGGRHKR